MDLPFAISLALAATIPFQLCWY